MNSAQAGGGRFRSYLQFFVAVLYFFAARVLARHGAERLGSDQWFPLAEQALLAVLLLLGYAGFGFILDRQQHPIRMQGLPRRPGMAVEAGLGLATGWGIAVACVLPLLVGGGIAIILSVQPSSWGWLVADAAFFALAALVEEIAFRGYGFQCFARSVGTFGAVLGFAAFYAIVQAMLPGSNRASIAVSIALSLLLSTAYLRTRALWLSWGLNFGWKASRALVFGLAVSGVNNHSSVVEGDPMGPFWLTGGGYGLDGSWVTCFVLVAALPVVFMLTRDLNFRYNAPVLVPGGIPVDLDAAARAQHENATRPAEPKAAPLVQIFPASAPSPARPENPPASQIIEPD
jgi:membrane protease YdiL (CAAX protease family)